MNVGELIEILETYDEELEVHLSYNYGDHWRTIVAPKVEYVKKGRVRWSSYHSMPRACDEDEEEDGDPVVILS